MFSKEYKREYKKIKELVSKAKDGEDLYYMLTVLYERITDRKDKDFSTKYPLVSILLCRTVDTLVRKVGESHVVIEFIQYKGVPYELMFILNVFNKDGMYSSVAVFKMYDNENENKSESECENE